MIVRYILSLLLIICINSCGFYSFSGASISNESKTVSVSYFKNTAGSTQPMLSQIMTEKLKDYFVDQTNLTLVNITGDLSFTGEIVKYDISPIDIKSNEVAGKNRLSISVNVKFINQQNDAGNFEQNFTRYRDYESALNISDIETILIEEITSEIAEDIFNKSVVNW